MYIKHKFNFKNFLYVFLLALVSCDSVTEVSSRDKFSKQFLGESYCTLEKLFVLERYEEDSKISDLTPYSFMRSGKYFSSVDAVEEYYKKYDRRNNTLVHELVSGSLITIEKIYYFDSFCCGGDEGYLPLARIENNEKFQGYIEMGYLFDPVHPFKAQIKMLNIDVDINREVLGECS